MVRRFLIPYFWNLWFGLSFRAYKSIWNKITTVFFVISFEFSTCYLAMRLMLEILYRLPLALTNEVRKSTMINILLQYILIDFVISTQNFRMIFTYYKKYRNSSLIIGSVRKIKLFYPDEQLLFNCTLKNYKTFFYIFQFIAKF